jgi:hypothetical protein
MGLFGAQEAWATTTTVGCSGLQAALDGAHNGDVIELNQLCANKSFMINNTNAFTLEGAGSGDGFNGNSTNTPILGTHTAPRLTIKNLLFENAALSSGGGAAIQFDADGVAVTITGDTFMNLTAPSGVGGAIQIEDSTDGAGTTTPNVISKNRFENNSADDGGAI